MNFITACIVTVAVETAFFLLLGYRDRLSLEIVALANVITNLSLTLLLAYVPWIYPFPRILIPEAVVVAAEYLVYRKAFGPSVKLFIITISANALTYIIGVLVQ